MPPPILAAHAPEFDLGRVVFVIMLLLGGFFQWVVTWWKKKQAEAERMRAAAPTPEELQARETAWRQQTGMEDPLPSQPATPNPLEDLLKTFRGIAQPEPPPLPVVIQPPPKVQAAPVEMPKLVAPRIVASAEAPAIVALQRNRNPMAMKLADLGGLRQAVVLREVLGPPKALQTGDDHFI